MRLLNSGRFVINAKEEEQKIKHFFFPMHYIFNYAHKFVRPELEGPVRIK